VARPRFPGPQGRSNQAVPPWPRAHVLPCPRLSLPCALRVVRPSPSSASSFLLASSFLPFAFAFGVRFCHTREHIEQQQMGTLKSKAARAHRGGKRRATHTAVLREAIDHGSDKLSNRNQFGGMLALGRATVAQSLGLAGENCTAWGPSPRMGAAPPWSCSRCSSSSWGGWRRRRCTLGCAGACTSLTRLTVVTRLWTGFANCRK
jgi:hypothetical protein